MKESVLLLACGLMLFSSCNSSRSQAVKWSNEVISIKVEADSIMQYMQSSLNHDNANLKEELSHAKNGMQSCMERLQEVKEFEKGKEFKAAAIELLNVYQSLLENEMTQLVEIMNDPQNTSDQYQRLEESMESTFMRGEAIDKKVKIAQADFASEYGIELAVK